MLAYSWNCCAAVLAALALRLVELCELAPSEDAGETLETNMAHSTPVRTQATRMPSATKLKVVMFQNIEKQSDRIKSAGSGLVSKNCREQYSARTPTRAFSSEVGIGSREENALK
jgi:hypothetical protein